mmetsp:Transcript_15306/g.47580  ORF Transcript_15306/g.47580 Transcript_15306/m.47580 type:complete len:323 (+) Transcript_15306:96-1064(+)
MRPPSHRGAPRRGNSIHGNVASGEDTRPYRRPSAPTCTMPCEGRRGCPRTRPRPRSKGIVYPCNTCRNKGPLLGPLWEWTHVSIRKYRRRRAQCTCLRCKSHHTCFRRTRPVRPPSGSRDLPERRCKTPSLSSGSTRILCSTDCAHRLSTRILCPRLARCWKHSCSLPGSRGSNRVPCRRRARMTATPPLSTCRLSRRRTSRRRPECRSARGRARLPRKNHRCHHYVRATCNATRADCAGCRPRCMTRRPTLTSSRQWPLPCTPHCCRPARCATCSAKIQTPGRTRSRDRQMGRNCYTCLRYTRHRWGRSRENGMQSRCRAR